jgi:hypothetical protein
MGRSTQNASSDDPPQAEEVADYVASLARGLKEMADSQQLSVLGYLLDLVRLEAEERARRESGGNRAPNRFS